MTNLNPFLKALKADINVLDGAGKHWEWKERNDAKGRKFIRVISRITGETRAEIGYIKTGLGQYSRYAAFYRNGEKTTVEDPKTIVPMLFYTLGGKRSLPSVALYAKSLWKKEA